MRRKDREIDRAAALSVVDRCEYAVLSMLDENGAAYGVPLSIVRDGESIFFHAAKVGKKTDSLRLHPAVSLACVGETERAEDAFTTYFESAVVRGTAVEVTDDAEKIRALRLLCERHTPKNMPAFDESIRRSLSITAVWKIEIQEVTGKQKKKK